VARQYGVSLRTVDTWLKQKKIPFLKLGSRLVRFDLDAVACALDRYMVKEVK
jgi:excisionase family DNA binding protein